jgi:hypothetical protein
VREQLLCLCFGDCSGCSLARFSTRARQVQALYVVGEEDADWFIESIDDAGRVQKKPALVRHRENTRTNQVARDRYCQLILKEGVQPELRVRHAERDVSRGSRGCVIDTSSCGATVL